MGLTMKRILEKYKEADMFSLTGDISFYNCPLTGEEYNKAIEGLNDREIVNFKDQFISNYTITEKQYDEAIQNIRKNIRNKYKKIYENRREEYKDYPDFDLLFTDIEEECRKFDCEENRRYYIENNFTEEDIARYKKLGISDKEIEEMKKNFFRVSFIADRVGEITKYGEKKDGFFRNLYSAISMIIEIENNKEEYCKNGLDPINQVPDELKKYLLYYKISFYNEVTVTSVPMINYYFKFNEETKRYLLNFKNDFELNELEDLSLYKDNKVLFSSCTHESFNSAVLDYKEMSIEEIIDYIDDEYPNQNNEKIKEVIKVLIDMKPKNQFTFKELGIDDKPLMYQVCIISGLLKLKIVLVKLIDNDKMLDTSKEYDVETYKGYEDAMYCNIDVEDKMIKLR